VGVFAGGFGEKACFGVVLLWWDRGDLRGGCGVLPVTFWWLKNTPTFSTLFLARLLRRCPAGRAHCAWSGHFVTFILFLLDGLALLG